MDNTEVIVEKVSSVLAKIAEQVGVGVDHFWPMLVRQQLIEAWTPIVALVLLVVPAAVFIRRAVRETHGDYTFIFAMATGVLTLIAAGAVLFESIPRFLNPEYYALKEILQAF